MMMSYALSIKKCKELFFYVFFVIIYFFLKSKIYIFPFFSMKIKCRVKKFEVMVPMDVCFEWDEKKDYILKDGKLLDFFDFCISYGSSSTEI